MNDRSLQRFVDAQHGAYEPALAELHAGAKRTHWMWFVFPQIAGLGHSDMAQFYAIADRAEALAYFAHPLLGPRLIESTEAMLRWGGQKRAEQILGGIDATKLRSSMTLFEIAGSSPVFASCLDIFYAGVRDDATLRILETT